MDDNMCHCAVCGGAFHKLEMHERKTEIYPYKRTIYLCRQCNDKREKQNVLKTAKREFHKTIRPNHYFK